MPRRNRRKHRFCTNGLVRNKLHLKTERRKEGYVIEPGEKEKINWLLEQYGIKPSKETQPTTGAQQTPEKDEHSEHGEHTTGDG